MKNYQSNPIKVFILLGGCIGVLISFFPGSALLLGIMCITGITLWHFLPEQDRKFLVKLFIFGLSIRVILFALLYIISVSRGGYGELTPDSRLFFIKSLDMIRAWRGQISSPWGQVDMGVGDNGYAYILSFFYLFLSYDPVIPNPVSMFSDKLINCLIGTLAGIPIFYIAKDIFGKRVAKISALLVVFFPSLIFWSMTNTREPINILLVSITLFLLLRFQKAGKIKYLPWFLISLLFLGTIRRYIFFAMLAVAGLSFLVFGIARIKRNFAFLVVITVLIGFILTNTSFGQSVYQRYFNLNSLRARLLETNYLILLQGGATYTIYGDPVSGGTSWLQLISGILKGTFHFMLVPFPWAISTKLQLFSYPQMILWYILIPFTILGIVIASRFRWQRAFAVMAYVFVVTFMYGAIEGNIGSTLRHRDLVLPFYFVFSAAGIVKIFSGKIEFEENV